MSHGAVGQINRASESVRSGSHDPDRLTEGFARCRGRADARSLALGLSTMLLGLLPGCGIAPHSFRAVNNPAPIVRARSIGRGDKLPDEKVIPALINRLVDTDPVVRMTAFEELKQRTGQDFGFVPWARPEENQYAVQRWRGWWQERKDDLARTRKKT
jgi:hypothetical protein